MTTTDARPLVMHLLYRLDTGGLENGVINLVNHMPEAAYRHCIVSLTEATDFQRRIGRPGVEVIAQAWPGGLCRAITSTPGRPMRRWKSVASVRDTMQCR